MAAVVKLLTDDDENKYTNNYWHYVVGYDARRTLCTLECFGGGESPLKFKEKTLKKGSVTCPACIERIERFKNTVY